jgi:hypothetical protein
MDCGKAFSQRFWHFDGNLDHAISPHGQLLYDSHCYARILHAAYGSSGVHTDHTIQRQILGSHKVSKSRSAAESNKLWHAAHPSAARLNPLVALALLPDAPAQPRPGASGRSSPWRGTHCAFAVLRQYLEAAIAISAASGPVHRCSYFTMLSFARSTVTTAIASSGLCTISQNWE